MASLLGGRAILAAMHSNEENTHTAYEPMTQRADKWEDAIEILNAGLEDEKRHKEWLECVQDKSQIKNKPKAERYWNI